MKPENGTEAHAAASQLVLDMIGVAYGPVEGEVETVFGGGALMKELKEWVVGMAGPQGKKSV